jgi:hypothetical protein
MIGKVNKWQRKLKLELLFAIAIENVPVGNASGL